MTIFALVIHPALALAIIAILESVAHLLRIRAAVGHSALWSGIHVVSICALRIGWIYTGVGAVMASAEPLTLVIAYAGTAGLATALLHGWIEHRKAKKTKGSAAP